MWPALLPRPFNCVILLLHSKAFLFLKGTFDGHFSIPGVTELSVCDSMSPAIFAMPHKLRHLIIGLQDFSLLKEDNLRDTRDIWGTHFQPWGYEAFCMWSNGTCYICHARLIVSSHYCIPRPSFFERDIWGTLFQPWVTKLSACYLMSPVIFAMPHELCHFTIAFQSFSFLERDISRAMRDIWETLFQP